MHNSTAWVTKPLNSDWFHQSFVPRVKIYLLEKGLPFDVLLLLDNAGGHATNLAYDGVRVEFLPSHTSSLIQPMDQVVIRAFKALYTRDTMANLARSPDTATENENVTFTLKAYWKTFTIAICLQNIQKTLQEMKPSTINASWKKLWLEVVYDDKGFTAEEIHQIAVQKAAQLASLI